MNQIIMTKMFTEQTKQQTNNIIKDLLLEKKAIDIVDIDVKSKNYISDNVIIASGTSSRHLQTMSDYIVKSLKDNGLKSNVEEAPDWILIDAFDVIVHLFRPEAREFYKVDELFVD